MAKKLKICVDLDNTIIDTARILVNLHNELHPNNTYCYTDDLEWDFYPIVKTKDELDQLCSLFAHKDFYTNVITYPSSIEVINNWCKQGHDVYIVSKHDEGRIPFTIKWASKVMPKVKLNFVSEFCDKGKFPCDVIIDDRLDSLDSFDGQTTKICFGNYSWNKDTKHRRFTNWVDLHKFIEGGM